MVLNSLFVQKNWFSQNKALGSRGRPVDSSGRLVEILLNVL